MRFTEARFLNIFIRPKTFSFRSCENNNFVAHEGHFEYFLNFYLFFSLKGELSLFISFYT